MKLKLTRERNSSPVRKSSSRDGLTLIEMAVVLLVMGILMVILGNMLSNVALLKDTKDEGELLKMALIHCRRSAIKSNKLVYVDFDLTTETYEAYRYIRAKEKLEKNVVLKPKELSSSNGIVAIITGSGNRITEGKYTLKFTPLGTASDSLAVQLGGSEGVQHTVIFGRYGTQAEVKKGEQEFNLENDDWKDLLELK